jgi:GT2 family glycosyltransferase
VLTPAASSPAAPSPADPPPARSLTVSIINYRTGALTLACVRSVLADLGGLAATVVVVDNRSDDGSAEEIEAWIAAQVPPVPVRLVRSATNSGFSGGHNQGIAAAPAAFYLVLNSDAVLRPGFFAALMAAAGAAPRAGLFAPRIDYDDGTQQISCFRFPTPASELIRGAATGPVTALLRRWDMPLAMPPAAAEIGWASFACILLRHEMLAEVGPMDEGYFLYFEDTEYCWRARRAGWRIAYVPEARAVHYRGGSGPVKALARARKRLPGYFYASRTRFFTQAHGRAGLLAANLAWHLGRGIAQARRLLGKPVPPANAREAGDLWINALDPLGDRRATKG